MKLLLSLITTPFLSVAAFAPLPVSHRQRGPDVVDCSWKQQQLQPHYCSSFSLLAADTDDASTKEEPDVVMQIEDLPAPGTDSASTNEEPEVVMQIEDLPQEQIVELIEVTFINACMVRAIDSFSDIIFSH